MALRNVEMIRKVLTNRLSYFLTNFRSFVSSTPDNVEAVDSMRGDRGDMILTRLTALILKEIGHDPQATNHRKKGGALTPVESSASAVRRQVRRVRASKPGAGDVE